MIRIAILKACHLLMKHISFSLVDFITHLTSRYYNTTPVDIQIQLLEYQKQIYLKTLFSLRVQYFSLIMD
jgi:hypothetical protein